MNNALSGSFARRWPYHAALFATVWVLFLSLVLVQHMVSGAFGWEQSLGMTLHQWVPWLLVSPFIFWLTSALPIERAGWWWRAATHAAACGVAVLATTAVTEQFVRPLATTAVTEQFVRPPPPFGEGFRPAGEPPPFDRPEPREPRPFRPDEGPRGFGRRPNPLWFRVRLNLPIYLVLVSLGHATVYFQRSQQRGRHALELEAHLAQARLQALRMQINPHFLFNTLNAISALVHTNPRLADEMIGTLSEMLRLSLDSAGEQEVPLSRELDFLGRYLEIEQARFGDRLRIEQQVSPEALTALVPTLILQPLVENAIRHGIEPKLAPGVVTIRAERAKDLLRLSIADTGVGLRTGPMRDREVPKGIGLANTRARLQSLYPLRHRFAMGDVPGGGCRVELEIPYHTDPVRTTQAPETS